MTQISKISSLGLKWLDKHMPQLFEYAPSSLWNFVTQGTSLLLSNYPAGHLVDATKQAAVVSWLPMESSCFSSCQQVVLAGLKLEATSQGFAMPPFCFPCLHKKSLRMQLFNLIHHIYATVVKHCIFLLSVIYC